MDALSAVSRCANALVEHKASAMAEILIAIINRFIHSASALEFSAQFLLRELHLAAMRFLLHRFWTAGPVAAPDREHDPGPEE